MAHKKSAKDYAFDRERAKYRGQIRNLQYQLADSEKNIDLLSNELLQKEEEIREKDDWIRRLLEYMDLSEEEMRSLIEKEKKEIHDEESSRILMDAAFKDYTRLFRSMVGD